MKTIAGYHHQAASHCETGSVRNLLVHAGVDMSEPMVYGLGSGVAFYYLFFVKGPSTFPMIGLRNRPGGIVQQLGKLCGIRFHFKEYRSTRQAIAKANKLIDAGTPVSASVEMFRMKYLPGFLRVHAPFHFVVLAGREGDGYTISDPYHAKLAHLSGRDLEAAWETHAPMSRNNLLVYVRKVPKRLPLKKAAAKAMTMTCRAMLLPRGVRRLLPFVGTEGIRLYARQLRRWPNKYRGVQLREGILFNAVGFEDQGTGGGAFRLMYGAFLQETAALFDSAELRDLAARLLEHGRRWRGASRQLVVLGRKVPLNEEDFDDWFAADGTELQQGLDELSDTFRAFADTEQAFFTDLSRAVKRLS